MPSSLTGRVEFSKSTEEGRHMMQAAMALITGTVIFYCSRKIIPSHLKVVSDFDQCWRYAENHTHTAYTYAVNT